MFSLMPRRARGEIARTEPLEWFRREFAPLFGRPFAAWPVPFEVPWESRWGFGMEEMENEFVVRAEVPGFEANELEVTLTGNELTIQAEHRAAEGSAPVERPHGRLVRTFTLPVGVNTEKVEACYRNGVVEVHLPKTPEAKCRRIEVKA